MNIISDLIKSHPVLSFSVFEEALKVAEKISKEELRGLGIVKRNRGKNFIVVTNTNRDRKCHDNFIMWVQNYENPYLIFSRSPKSGEHEEGYPTKEMADMRYKELKNGEYRTNIYKKYPV